jgi:hypothetical protein
MTRPERRRLLRLAAALGAVVVVVGGWGAWRIKRYVDEDPGLCAQCHRASPEFALWNEGSHKGVSCQRCHHATPAEGLAMLRSFLAGKPPGGKKGHAQVEVGACAACHLSHDPKWPQIEASRGHRVHVAGQKIACVRCHANAMHGFAPPTDSCKECHGAHMVNAVGMQQLHCFACHNFLSQDPGLRPTRHDCLRCHRQQGVHPSRFADDAPMQFACSACHHPHATSAKTMRTDCRTCHTQIERGGLHGSRGHRDCAKCHPAHLWRTEDGTCARCHGDWKAHAGGKRCSLCHSFAGGGYPLQPKEPPPLPDLTPASLPGAATAPTASPTPAGTAR